MGFSKTRAEGNAASGRRLRLVYVAGAGNLIGSYRHWSRGEDDPTQVALTYASQFFDVCRDLDAEAWAIVPSREPDVLHDGSFRIEHRLAPDPGRAGLRFHQGQAGWVLGLLASIVRFRADAAVITNGRGHWSPLTVLPLLGIRAIPAIHCVLWRHGTRPGGVRKLVWALDRSFFRGGAAAILSASNDITEQVEALTSGRHGPVFPFLPTYRPETFEGLDDPPAPRRPFRVLYAGRIERYKGVFDLLAIAGRFAAAGRTEIEFDLCGDGPALEELRRRAEADGLADWFRCHGHCRRPTMRALFGASHVVIAPTTSDFVEGFNQVVAEGVLCGRPVITSTVCPALEYVREAVVEVPPDDVAAYGDAILELCDDEVYYRAKRAACAAAQPPFYDPARGWAAALRRALGRLAEAEGRRATGSREAVLSGSDDATGGERCNSGGWAGPA